MGWLSFGTSPERASCSSREILRDALSMIHFMAGNRTVNYIGMKKGVEGGGEEETLFNITFTPPG